MGGRGGASHMAMHDGGLSRAMTFLVSNYGQNHAEAIMEFLNRIAPDDVREMWTEFGGKFRAVTSDPYTDRAFYSPTRSNVTLGIEYVAAGDDIHSPYSTVFHEYGHMADNLIARKMGYGRYDDYSKKYKDGLLGRTAKAELQERISGIRQRNPQYTREQAIGILISEAKRKYSLLDRSDISDMLEGAGIGTAYPLGVGHGLNYWRRVDNGAEIFAEITSAEASNPRSLRAIKEYFPKTYAVYHQMLKERKNR